MILAIAFDINNPVHQAFLAVFAVVFVVNLLFVSRIMSYVVQAQLAGVPATFFDVLGMRFRRSDVKSIIHNAIALKHGSCEVPLQAIESHLLAGGDIAKTAKATIAAKQAGIPLTWDEATRLDLAGQDVLEVVRQKAKTGY